MVWISWSLLVDQEVINFDRFFAFTETENLEVIGGEVARRLLVAFVLNLDLGVAALHKNFDLELDFQE